MRTDLTRLSIGFHAWRTIGAAFAAICAIGYPALSPASATDLKVGGIGIIAPTYEGSDSYRVIGTPFAYPVFSSGPSNGAFTVNGLDDVRFRLVNQDGFEAEVIAGYAFGRDADDGPLLRGLGDIDDGFIAGGYLGYRMRSVLLDVSYHHIVNGDDTGGYLRFGATNSYRVSTALEFKARVGATYADSDYMQSYFGVSSGQSAASLAGIPAYETDAGFKDVHLNLSATYDIDANWSLLAGAGYKRLIGDAADSPIVETADQFTAVFGVTYRFTVR